MIPEKNPAQMIADQIALLRSEESKLKKFINYNQEAKPAVDVHLEEIQRKKKKLYNLCEMMGIEAPAEKKDNESVTHQRIPQPTGRFGSRLIKWHS